MRGRGRGSGGVWLSGSRVVTASEIPEDLVAQVHDIYNDTNDWFILHKGLL